MLLARLPASQPWPARSITVSLLLIQTIVLIPGRAVLTGLVGLLGLALWLRARSRLSGLTLMAAWAWTGLTLAVQTAAALVAATGKPGGQPGWSYLAAITVFGPTMAVLGAKRPQHRAWQLIVLVLLVVLAMPGFEALLFGRREITVHGLLGGLMVLLIAIGVFNYLPTRFWPAALMMGFAEAVLLAPYLAAAHVRDARPTLALAIEVGAAVLATRFCWRPTRAASDIDRLWIDFRNSLGAIWALRVQERFNAAARQHAWPVVLHWSGLKAADSGSEPRASESVRNDVPERTLRMLLRRFVSDAWIQRRRSVVLCHRDAEHKPDA